MIKLKTGLINRNIESLRQRVSEQNELICGLEDKKLPSYLESLNRKLEEKQRELKSLVEPKKVDEPKSKPSKEVEDKITSLNTSIEETEKQIGEKQQELKNVNQHITKLQNLEIVLDSIQKQLDEFLSGYAEDLKLLEIDSQKLIEFKLDKSIITTKKRSLNATKDKLTVLLSEDGDDKTSLVAKKKGIQAELKKIFDGLDKEN